MNVGHLQQDILPDNQVAGYHVIHKLTQNIPIPVVMHILIKQANTAAVSCKPMAGLFRSAPSDNLVNNF